MKTVGIMTINSLNYGNRLQNYALQTWLSSLGYDVKTIPRVYEKKGGIKVSIKELIRFLLGTRASMFRRFNKKYIKFAKHKAYVDTIEEGLEDEFDVLIAGSDQVWNPFFDGLTGKADLLAFPTKSKKISYAASFGVDSIPDARRDSYYEALKDYSAISVREKEGTNITKEIIGRNAELMPDPTLLIGKADWVRIEKKPKCAPNKDYILLYFLGNEEPPYDDICRYYLNNTTLLFDILKPGFLGQKPHIGPAEFVWLIHHAEYVFTNSFHATVFSIIFNVPVNTYCRKGIDMSSRIKTLSIELGIEHLCDKKGTLLVNPSHDDLEFVNTRIDEMKKKAERFIKDAIE